jgi:hypothetical protein
MIDGLPISVAILIGAGTFFMLFASRILLKLQQSLSPQTGQLFRLDHAEGSQAQVIRQWLDEREYCSKLSFPEGFMFKYSVEGNPQFSILKKKREPTLLYVEARSSLDAIFKMHRELKNKVKYIGAKDQIQADLIKEIRYQATLRNVEWRKSPKNETEFKVSTSIDCEKSVTKKELLDAIKYILDTISIAERKVQDKLESIGRG